MDTGQWTAVQKIIDFIESFGTIKNIFATCPSHLTRGSDRSRYRVGLLSNRIIQCDTLSRISCQTIEGIDTVHHCSY